MEMSALNGGHAAAHRYSQSSVVHVDVHEPPFNASRYNIDTDEAMTRIRLLKPTLIVLGAQDILFPHPVSLLGPRTSRLPSNASSFPAPIGPLDAFATSGGTSTRPRTFKDKVKVFQNKTLRCPASYAQLKTMHDQGPH
jgi:hypothetical protein